MTTVLTVLDILWAHEKVLATSILSADEKQVVIGELKNALPHPMHSTAVIGTRDIVAKHLIPPSIKDEVTVGIPNSPRPSQDTSVPNRNNQSKKETRTKA